MDSFKHGGDVVKFAMQQNCSVDDIIDLSSNINFVKPNITIDINDIKIDHYPSYDRLYEKIANYFDTKCENIEIFNGGSSAIFSLLRFFKQQKCYIYSPAYLEYKKASLLNDKDLVFINRYKNLYQTVEENSIVIFVNPSTPDGIYYDMIKLLNMWKEKNCTILIDESFLSFTTYKSVVKYIKTIPNLYILKSMTKFHSCAGVRMGVVISSKENIKNLSKYEPAWKLSNYDCEVVLNVLEDKDFNELSLKKNEIAKQYLLDTIKDHNIFDKNFDIVFKSSANFVLTKLKDITAKEFQDKLAVYNILIRDCSNFDFLDQNHVRIAIKNLNNMKRFDEVLKKIVF